MTSGSESETPAPTTSAAKPKRNLLKKAGSDSDSSDSSDSDSDSDSDDSDKDSDDDSDKPAKPEAKKPAGSRFLKGAASDDSDDSSDDERGKVVKSAKSKRADEVDACVKTIENGGKINDWVSISNGTFPPLLTRSRVAAFTQISCNLFFSCRIRQARSSRLSSSQRLRWHSFRFLQGSFQPR